MEVSSASAVVAAACQMEDDRSQESDAYCKFIVGDTDTLDGKGEKVMDSRYAVFLGWYEATG